MLLPLQTLPKLFRVVMGVPDPEPGRPPKLISAEEPALTVAQVAHPPEDLPVVPWDPGTVTTLESHQAARDRIELAALRYHETQVEKVAAAEKPKKPKKQRVKSWLRGGVSR